VIPSDRGRAAFKRYGGPASLMLAGTAAVVLIRPSLHEESTPPPAPAPQTKPAPARATKPPYTAPRVYAVRTGDTLGSIAERFHTSLTHLVELNPSVQPHALRVGQQIRLR
jgi:LysM repeat protein